jgi:Dolichyl-phosphate-mannose-protein mannosyltransferase
VISRTAGPPSARELRLALAVVLITAAILRLAYAFARPDSNRFWDEQYSFQNVAALLADGHWRPAHALYPSLSFLPHTAVLAASDGLYRLTGVRAFAIFTDRENHVFSATAYRLVRGVSVFFGVWSLVLLYRLGRRVLDAPSALVGTLLLATFWRHVTASGEFKPDSVVMALALLSIGWSLEAVRSGSWPAFLLAGAGVGLVTSAKYNGALLALVPTVAVALRGRQAIPLLPKLAAAAGASLAVFALLNPWPSMVWRGFQFQAAFYERVSARRKSDFWQVLQSTAEFFTRHQGVLVALAAAAGLAVLSWRAVRAWPRCQEVLVLVAFTVGYPVIYALVTANFQTQNMLPVVCLGCLFAGWTMVAVWRRLEGRFSGLSSRRARGLAFSMLFVLLVRFPVTAAYAEVVPTTTTQSAARLAEHLSPPWLRVVVYERFDEKMTIAPGALGIATLPVAKLTDVESEALDFADAEVFRADRLTGSDAEAYLRRMVRPESWLDRVRPGFLAARGPELVLIFHPWNELGPARPLEVADLGQGRRRVRLDGVASAGDVISISLVARGRGPQLRVFGLWLDGRPLPVHYTGAMTEKELHFVSQRRTLGSGPHEMVVVQDENATGSVLPSAALHRWERRRPG